MLAFVASWHLPSLSGPIHPPTLCDRRPRAQLALQLRPDSPRGLTAEIEALAQRVSALGRALRGKGRARVPEAEEDGSSCEGQGDPEEAALRRLESDLLAAEAAASELLAAAAEAPTEAEDPALPPPPSVYTFTPPAGRRAFGGPAAAERQRPPPPPPLPPLPPRSPLLRVRDSRVMVMVMVFGLTLTLAPTRSPLLRARDSRVMVMVMVLRLTLAQTPTRSPLLRVASQTQRRDAERSGAAGRGGTGPAPGQPVARAAGQGRRWGGKQRARF